MVDGKLRLLISEQGPGALLMHSRWWTVTPLSNAKILDILPGCTHQQPMKQQEKTMVSKTRPVTKAAKAEKAPAKVAPIEAAAPKRRGRPRKAVEESTVPTMPVQARAVPSKAPAKSPVKAAPAKAKPQAKPQAGKPPHALGGRKPGSKFDLIYKMLSKPKGCTRSEMLEKIGWQAISMQQAAKRVGLELRQEKSGTGLTRYYGNSLR
jgi:Protein of unknown function (DUF3489)